MNKLKYSSQQNVLISLLFSLSFSNPIIFYLLSHSIWATSFSQLIYFVAIYFVLDKKYWWKSYLINILVLVSILFYSEILFKTIFKDYIIDDFYQIVGKTYFNKPFLEKHINDKEYSVLYRTDMQGFRIDQSMIDNVTVDKCDWLFIGDSFTQGAQVDFRDLYTSQLYKMVPDKIIVNAGISGLGIAQELELYKLLYPKLKPKKVFLQLCNFNDFMNVELKEPAFNEYLMEYSDLARSILYNIKYQSPGELPLGRWTEPFYSTESQNQDYNIFYKNKSETKLKDLKYINKYLLEFVAETKKDGCELIIILLPTKEQIYYEDFHEVISNYDIRPSDLDMEYPNKVMKQICEDNNIELVDMYLPFGAATKRLYFYFDEHLNEQGHKKIAEILFEKYSEKNSHPIIMNDSYEGQRYPSIDHKRINYQVNINGNSELFRTDLDYINISRLSYNNVDEYHPWSDIKNNILVFTQGNSKSFETKVVLSDTNGENRRTITNKKNEYGSIPSISKDCKYITYASWERDSITGDYSIPDIVLYNIMNKSKSYITRSENIEEWRPVFIDSVYIVFIAKINNQFDIFKINIYSKQLVQLTNTSYDEWDPRVSDDGRYIVYAGKKDDNWDLFRLDLKTNAVIQITETKGNEWDPCFGNSVSEIYYAGVYGHFNGIYKISIPKN